MNSAVLQGATAARNMGVGSTRLEISLEPGVAAQGVSVAANQFTVDGAGQYIATVSLNPTARNVSFQFAIHVWNATLGASAGSATLTAQLNTAGVETKTVDIPFNVANATHLYEIRVVIATTERPPALLDLSVLGSSIMRVFLRSLAGAVDGGLYGDGSGGTVVAGTGVLTEDMYYENLTIPAGVTLNPNGFKIFVRNTLTMVATGVIANNGGNGANADAGGAAGAATGVGSVGESFVGAAGAVGAGVAGTNATTSAGGAGGLSGAGAGGAGAAGGTVTAPTVAQGAGAADPLKLFRASPQLGILLGAGVAGAQTLVRGGAGGASGGGNGLAVTGAGGGGGGGGVVIVARAIVGTGTIRANGGAGGTGAAAVNAGGGGGGGGGFVLTVAESALPATITVQALGGAAGGAGAGGGVAGGAGAAGNTLHVQTGV